MKKILSFVALVLLLGGQGVVTATTYNPLPAPQGASPNSNTLPPSVINGIEVPYDVVMQVQLKHQGYAVTYAERIRVQDAEGFRLRATRDDTMNGGSAIYLAYTKQWKLVSEDAVTLAPPAPKHHHGRSEFSDESDESGDRDKKRKKWERQSEREHETDEPSDDQLYEVPDEYLDGDEDSE